MDQNIYISVDKQSESEIVEKKSRFICNMKHIESEEEALDFIKQIKKKYYDARHNVYAYIIGDGSVKKCSDDGEPSKTAGIPIMQMLEGERVTDVVCVVTRYFGGTLLGTGGLIRAYTKAAKDCLAVCGLLKKTMCDIVEINCEYTFLRKVEHILKTGGYLVDNIDYGESVIVRVICEKAKTAVLFNEITDAFSINVSAKAVDEVYYTL